MAIRPRPRPVPATGVPSGTPSFSLEGSEIANVIGQIHTQFGVEVARFMNTASGPDPRIRTSIFSIDLGLSGGWLMSRGVMLYGEKAAGKTTVAMFSIIEAQRQYRDMVVIYIDIEGTFDKTWFMKLGGDLGRLVLVEPESGEAAVDMADALVRTKEASVIVTDSIAMLIPMKEITASAEDSLPGVHARLVGNYLRRVNNAMLQERHRGHRPLILHINQFRMKIGLVFGDPRVLPGGKALEFATSQQIEMKNHEKINEQGDVMFNEHSFKITKDKSGGRIREGKFKLVRSSEHCDGLPEGFVDQTKTMIAAGERVGLVSGRYEFAGFGKKPSADDWTKYFLGEPEAYARVQRKIINEFRTRWGLGEL